MTSLRSASFRVTRKREREPPAISSLYVRRELLVSRSDDVHFLHSWIDPGEGSVHVAEPASLSP